MNDHPPDAVGVGCWWFSRIALGDERHVARIARGGGEWFLPGGDAATGAMHRHRHTWPGGSTPKVGFS
jgi:hypothetical protein